MRVLHWISIAEGTLYVKPTIEYKKLNFQNMNFAVQICPTTTQWWGCCIHGSSELGQLGRWTFIFSHWHRGGGAVHEHAQGHVQQLHEQVHEDLQEHVCVHES